MTRVNQPIFTKREPRPYDNRPMNHKILLNLKKWAAQSAEELGYPIYLVGSSLEKAIPRDIDVAVILPLEDFETLFGNLPETSDGYSKYLMDVWNNVPRIARHFFRCQDAIGERTLDFKICPDTWFPGRPKLLLGKPKD